MGLSPSKPDKNLSTPKEIITPQLTQPQPEQQGTNQVQMPLAQIQNKPERQLPPLKLPPGRKSTQKVKKTKEFFSSTCGTPSKRGQYQSEVRESSPEKVTSPSNHKYPFESDAVKAQDSYIKTQVTRDGSALQMSRPIDKSFPQKIKKFRPSREQSTFCSPPVFPL